MEEQRHDQVVFQNVADQYVKGEDVAAFFTISKDITVNPDEDQIGLLRVGCTNIKECLAYAAVQFNPSKTLESTRCGTATFPSSSLIVNDEQFYQFCYLIKKTKYLGSSIPFQLNCALDDHDNDDIVVLSTKRMLTEEKLRQENRQSLNTKLRLESQKNPCQVKLDLLETQKKEHVNKICTDMQTLTPSYKTTTDELSSQHQSESDVYRSLCNKYQIERLLYAKRYRLLENDHAKTLDEVNRLRSQLTVTSQLTKDQAIQIIDLERRLIQSNELSQTSVEREFSDFRLTTEKYQRSVQGQLDAYSKRVDQINAIETTNSLLKEELNSLKTDYELALSRIKLNEKNSNQQSYITLKTSFTEIEKRCLKHQKNEIDVKRQLRIYQNFVNDLQREIQYLTERVSTGAEEYKTLFGKYSALECKIGINHEQEKTEIINENQQEKKKDQEIKSISTENSFTDVEIHICPICDWQFPQHLTLDGRKEHIEHHCE